MKYKDVVPINVAKAYCGIGSYSYEISQINQNVKSLVYDYRDLNADYYGTKIKSTGYYIRNGWLFNAYAPERMFDIPWVDNAIHYLSVIYPINKEIMNKHNTIVTVHDIMPIMHGTATSSWLYKQHFRSALNYFIKNNVTMIASSEYVKYVLRNYGIKNNIEVVRIPVTRFKNELQLFENKQYFYMRNTYRIMSVGFTKNKNIELLKQIFKYLPDNYTLVRIGNEIKGIKNQEVYSNLKTELLNGLYNETDLTLSLSYDEGLDLIPLESMYSGTAVLMSDIPVHRENFDNDIYLFNLHDNPERIAHKIIKIVTDPELQKEQFEYFEKNIKSKFSQELFKKEMDRIAEENLYI